MNILIKHIMMIDPFDRTEKRVDILILDDKLAEIGDKIQPPANIRVLDGEKLAAAPGLVDMHCHLREPGFTHKEDIQSGMKSAVAGGFTTVAAMPNTRPTADSKEVIKLVKSKADLINVLPIGAITYGLAGERMTNFEELIRAGAVAFSDDGIGLVSGAIMEQAIEKAHTLGVPVISHCEDVACLDPEQTDPEIIYKNNCAAEQNMVAREAMLAAKTGGRVHIAHVSTLGSVEIIRRAKKEGVKVTAETCPHYFSLTNQALKTHGANAKMNPPLGRQQDVDAVITGLQDGTIDAIATDHAPHSPEEKQGKNPPNGIIGFETALPVSITYLYKTGKLSLLEIIKKLTIEPAKILGIDIKSRAQDLVIFAPDQAFEYREIESKSQNTPYYCQRLYGKVYCTISRGNTVYNRL